MSATGFKLAFRILLWTVVILIGLMCSGFPGLDILGYLLVGWIPFLDRVSAQTHLRWDLVWSTLAYVLLLIITAQWFLRWLYRSLQSTPASTGNTGNWRWSWTLSAVILVLITFAAGISTIGIVHQTAWLATSPEPLYRGGHPLAYRVKCASNLRMIGLALSMYADNHGGKFPNDLKTLIEYPPADLTPDVFACPDDYDEKHGRASADRSYIYFGRGVTTPARADAVLAIDPPGSHGGDGINVLYGDGHVEWLNIEQAEPLLLKLGFERVEKMPSR